MNARLVTRRLSTAEQKGYTESVMREAVPAITAAVIMILYRRGWHKDKLISLYQEVVSFFKYPQYFGKWLTDEEIKATLTERIGIDWKELADAAVVSSRATYEE